MSEMPMFDDPIPTSIPVADGPPKRKPAKKKRGRPPGSPNKAKAAPKKRRKLRVARVNLNKDNAIRARAVPAAKLTPSEMEMVLGVLQSLGGFDPEAKKRILDRVRALA